MNGMMGGGFGIFGMLLGAFFWIAIIALIVWAVVRLTRGRTGNGGGASEVRPDSAEETLRQRYARGEIGDEEYGRSLSTLRGGSSADRDHERG
jgi:putative membrane protein